MTLGWIAEFSWSWTLLAAEWLVRLVLLAYIPQRRPPAAARTWLLLIFLFPWAGLLIYLIVGRIQIPKRRRKLLEKLSRTVRQAATGLPPEIRTPIDQLPEGVANAARLAAEGRRLFGGDMPSILIQMISDKLMLVSASSLWTSQNS